MKKIIPIILILFACSDDKPHLLSKEEYLKFGQKIAYSLKHGQIKQLKNNVYLTNTYDKLVDQIDSLEFRSFVSDAQLKSYRIELYDEFSEYFQVLIHLAEQNGKIEVSNYYQRNGQPHIVLAVSSGNSIDFADFQLITLKEQTFIANYQSYNTGIDFADSFIWNAINKLKFGWLGGEYIQALSELKNAHIYLQRNQPERAWTAINRIPDDFLYQSNFQIVKAKIASQLSDSLYINTLYDWISFNWDQEGFRHLRAFEYYLSIGDNSEAKLHLDSLKSMAGNCHLLDELEQRVK